MSHVLNIIYGDTDGATSVPASAEALGDRLLALSNSCLAMLNACRDALAFYSANEISDMVAVLEPERGIFGSNMTKQLLIDGMTCVENFKKMLNNEVATQGDYNSTIHKWSACTNGG